MFKSKLVLLFVLGSVSICFAERPVARFSQPILTSGSSNAGIYAVYCSSNVATAIRPPNIERKGLVIYNENSFSVYIATYSALETGGYSKLFKLKTDASFEDNLEAYTSSWYVLGTSTATVTVIEKW